MIRLFTGQVRKIRGGNAGQALPLILVTLVSLLSLAFATVYVSHLGASRVGASRAIDAIALSAATWEARGLNLIAALNDGILQCVRVIRWIVAVWAALAVAACFGGGMSAFLSFSRKAPRMIRSCWNLARTLERWSLRVRDSIPRLVLAETVSLSRRLGATGLLRPSNPEGPHDGRETLELHVRPGPEITLAEAILPLTAWQQKLGKKKWARKILRRVAGIVNPIVGSLIRENPEPIRPLVPEDDFRERQKVTYSGFRESLPVPSPFPEWGGAKRFWFSAKAQPYGGTHLEMTWRSRLIPEEDRR